MKRKQPFTFEEFKAIYSKVPRLCVDLVIKTEKGVLLTFRTKNGYENQWHLPGGTIYYRERAEDAVKRVAMEELGIDVVINKFAGYLEYFSEVKERGFGYTVTLVFICKPINSEFKLDDQTEKVEFFDKIPDNTISEQKVFLEQLILQPE
ncbi:NUDIX hydrolase [Candidatus Dojkabacteria bacterium]|nr:NUDIX hydrolase [Candidatus Dojkabacteria bacterium]